LTLSRVNPFAGAGLDLLSHLVASLSSKFFKSSIVILPRATSIDTPTMFRTILSE